MNVLTINTLYAPNILGGAEITVKSIVDGLHRRGHHLSVLTTGDSSKPGVTVDSVDEIPVYRVGIENNYWHYDRRSRSGLQRAMWHWKDRLNFSMAPYIHKVIDHAKPDVIFTHNLVGFSVIAWEIAQLSNIPIIHVMHDPYLICPRSNMFHKDNACMKQCLPCKLLRLDHPVRSQTVRAVVGVSRFILDLHLKHGYFDAVPLKRVIHNARALPGIASIQRSFSLDRPLRFGFLGTLAVSKGIVLLLDAFEKLNRRNPGMCELMIGGIGDQDVESVVRERMKDLPGKCLGYVKPDLFFSEIDVLVVPSIWNDTFPGVVFESLGFGVPVLGARRGGIPEMISHGKNGWLFEPTKEGELELSMEFVLKNVDGVEVMSRNARGSAIPYMNIDRMLDEYEDLVNLVVKDKCSILKRDTD